MPTTRRDDEEPLGSDFEEKVSELDFDVWGSDSDDVARRRDPLRRRSAGFAPSPEEEEEV